MNIISRQYLRIFKIPFINSNILSGVERTYCYKSAYSLDKLYPKSSLKLYTPEFILNKPDEVFSGYIPVKKLNFKYTTSSGSGGQNVNRVNTKVELRFHVQSASWLSENIKEKLMKACKNRISKDGYFIIKSEITRSQQLNQADALEKLRNIIRKVEKIGVETVISEEDAELLRKRHIKASRERILVKRSNSEIKQHRNSVNPANIF